MNFQYYEKELAIFEDDDVNMENDIISIYRSMDDHIVLGFRQEDYNLCSEDDGYGGKVYFLKKKQSNEKPLLVGGK